MAYKRVRLWKESRLNINGELESMRDYFFFFPFGDDAEEPFLIGVALATPGAMSKVSPVFSSTTNSRAGCHLIGFWRYIGQGGRVNRQERMNPAAKIYMVWENCKRQMSFPNMA